MPTIPITITIQSNQRTAVLPINLVADAANPVSRFAFAVNYPAGLTLNDIVLGAAAVGKSLATGAEVSPRSIDIFGTEAVIPSGELVVLTFTGLPGTYAVTLSGLTASQEVTDTATPPVTTTTVRTSSASAGSLELVQ